MGGIPFLIEIEQRRSSQPAYAALGVQFKVGADEGCAIRTPSRLT